MPLHTSEALILKTYKLGEADRIVVFLTRDRGKKRGVAKGARRTRSRFLGALEPLTRASVAYFEREGRELVGLNYAETLASPLAAAHPEALAHVSYFAALIDEWAQDNDPSETLFRLGVSMLDALATADDVPVLARYFEFWLLRLQGVYPSIRRCPQCGGTLASGARLAIDRGVFLCESCVPGGRAAALSADAIAFLGRAVRLRPNDVGRLACATRVVRELEHAHRALLSHHLEKDLKSSRVLRELRH